ncbi:MAG: ARMT1-like domain-containing protein [Phycisphaerae bacterium]|jgi:type II pantothenate kinase
MSHFCLLSHPESYLAHDWDLIADEPSRQLWLKHYTDHFEVALKYASAQYGRMSGKSCATAKQQFAQAISQLQADPASLPGGKLNVLELCRLRDRTLRANGLKDVFKHVKDRENASAMALYPEVVRKLHVMNGADKWLHLVKCVFAGNIFDLGSKATMHLANQSTDFLAAVKNGKPRPWLIDDYDRLAADLLSAPPAKWAKAVVFVDNAGTDFVLGIMPLVRELALVGTKVVLAANELPSLNDMTADETVDVIERLAAVDEDLASLISAEMFEVVSTGTDTPMIDLSAVSDELNAAAADAELVILEGMGRAVESNLSAAFKVDTLNLALLKDPNVAHRLGGEVFDCVCKYTPAGS